MLCIPGSPKIALDHVIIIHTVSLSIILLHATFESDKYNNLHTVTADTHTGIAANEYHYIYCKCF